MEGVTDNKLIRIIYISIAFVFITVLMQNIDNPWLIIFLSALFALSLSIRNILIYPNDKHHHLGRIGFLIDILIIFLICSNDRGGSALAYYLILIGDAALAYSVFFSGAVTVLCFLSFLSENYITIPQKSVSGLLSVSFPQTLAFLITFAIMNIVKYEILQREKLSRTMYELKLKTKQLENVYFKLKESSEDIEEMTIIEERNRIAREIHDTVGHTLTTVLIELEAGERLLEKDPVLATDKLRLAKAQVRKGLGDIRESVGILSSGREILGFIPSIRLLLEETTRHGDVFIKEEIGELPKLSPQQEKALYRALQEGLTNGIKHGKSTAFVFKLKYENGFIRFLLQDNGKGSDKIIKGFGLTIMEQRIGAAGGILNISSSYGEGLSIGISIPVNKEKSDGTDTNSNCG